MPKLKVAKVILRIAKDLEFDYLIPEGVCVKKGMRVLVEFGKTKRIGIVVGLKQN